MIERMHNTISPEVLVSSFEVVTGGTISNAFPSWEASPLPLSPESKSPLDNASFPLSDVSWDGMLELLVP